MSYVKMFSSGESVCYRGENIFARVSRHVPPSFSSHVASLAAAPVPWNIPKIDERLFVAEWHETYRKKSMLGADSEYHNNNLLSLFITKFLAKHLHILNQLRCTLDSKNFQSVSVGCESAYSPVQNINIFLTRNDEKQDMQPTQKWTAWTAYTVIYHWFCSVGFPMSYF